MSSENLAAVILAAGQGTRMNCDLAKVLHPLGGKTLIDHVVEAVIRIGADPVVVVVGHQHEQIRERLGSDVVYVFQHEQLGTGHAFIQAKEVLSEFTGQVLVVNGDTPLLTQDALMGLISEHRNSSAQASMISTIMDNPSGYGRIRRGTDGTIRVVEEKNASTREKSITEVNTGVYCFNSPLVWELLDELSLDPVSNEMYIVSLFTILADRGLSVQALLSPDHEAFVGINDHSQLATAETILNRRTIERLMKAGVLIVDPATTRIGPDVVINHDAIIHPLTVISGATRIEAGAEVGPHAIIKNSTIGKRARVIASLLDQAVVGDDCSVGPFSHLRPGSTLEHNVKVGNFAEIKNSTIGTGTKVPHHSYVGDSIIGKRVNIGAGTVTVNYDGVNKSTTTIGDDAFIGCNSNLVAPVTISPGAYVGAGSTITKDVPEDALAISRAPQTIFAAWAKRRRKSRQKRDES